MGVGEAPIKIGEVRMVIREALIVISKPPVGIGGR
jgi:hypothetical protein